MATWNLFDEIESLRREINDAFRGIGSRGPFGPAFRPGGALRRYPPLNLYGDDRNLYVEALVPGVEPDKLEVTVQDNVLIVAGERPAVDDKDRAWHRRECESGRFKRTLELPVDVDADKVQAAYRNGVLTITLPKAAALQPKKIAVKAD
jgi:HSP20 family protein